jgi:hypothetical protein
MTCEKPGIQRHVLVSLFGHTVIGCSYGSEDALTPWDLSEIVGSGSQDFGHGLECLRAMGRVAKRIEIDVTR